MGEAAVGAHGIIMIIAFLFMTQLAEAIAWWASNKVGREFRGAAESEAGMGGKWRNKHLDLTRLRRKDKVKIGFVQHRLRAKATMGSFYPAVS
jgi:hypothetical protein